MLKSCESGCFVSQGGIQIRVNLIWIRNSVYSIEIFNKRKNNNKNVNHIGIHLITIMNSSTYREGMYLRSLQGFITAAGQIILNLYVLSRYGIVRFVQEVFFIWYRVYAMKIWLDFLDIY